MFFRRCIVSIVAKVYSLQFIESLRFIKMQTFL